jgi:TatD DNase family protein
MSIIDTHAHVYADEFDTDLAQVLERARRTGVSRIYLPAIDSQTHERLLAVTSHPAAQGMLYPMMGVHPCSINASYQAELDTALRYLDNGTRYAAVGEIGLDYHWDTTYQAEQIAAFEIQIGWAIARDLPIAIHSRKSTYDCIEILKKYKGRLRGVFHCFGGSLEEATEITKLGLYLGIGGVVTYKNAGLKQVLPAIGLDRVILETDAPYLSPVPHRGKRNEPAYTRLIAEEIAHIMGMNYTEVASVTTQNALALFG